MKRCETHLETVDGLYGIVVADKMTAKRHWHEQEHAERSWERRACELMEVPSAERMAEGNGLVRL